MDDPRSALRKNLDESVEIGTLSVDRLDYDELQAMNDLLSFFEFLAALVKFGALDFDQVKAVFPHAPLRY